MAMAPIKAEEAPRRALYRLMKVLRLKLGDELTPLNDTNNIVPVPDADSYFIGSTEDDILQVLNAKGAGCFIYSLGPSIVEAPRTGDGVTRAKLHRSTIRVTFVFRQPSGYEDYAIDGYSVMPYEILYHLADRIRVAALLTIYKYAVDSDNIHEVDITSQDTGVVVTNNTELTGRAILDVVLLQDVEVPMPTYSVA